jgi:hypothetical protein
MISFAAKLRSPLNVHKALAGPWMIFADIKTSLVRKCHVGTSFSGFLFSFPLIMQLICADGKSWIE